MPSSLSVLKMSMAMNKAIKRHRNLWMMVQRTVVK
uniref:Uncharacterized protein n=1 Tax=Arundo donax TaxID=35708 RepID=A0A0A9EZ67_ARUDO